MKIQQKRQHTYQFGQQQVAEQRYQSPHTWSDEISKSCSFFICLTCDTNPAYQYTTLLKPCGLGQGLIVMWSGLHTLWVSVLLCLCDSLAMANSMAIAANVPARPCPLMKTALYFWGSKPTKPNRLPCSTAPNATHTQLAYHVKLLPFHTRIIQ